MPLQTGRDRGNRLLAGHHADLNRAYCEIRKHRMDLSCDNGWRDILNGRDPAGVLRGDGRDHAGTIDAERRERLQIRLDTGTATGI
ncbi:hypothetical protein D9M70_466400 [compost metagenome]